MKRLKKKKKQRQQKTKQNKTKNTCIMPRLAFLLRYVRQVAEDKIIGPTRAAFLKLWFILDMKLFLVYLVGFTL